MKRSKPRLEDQADFVIVGTGAGGATAARVLTGAGWSVILIEEGPQLTPQQRSVDVLSAMSESMRDMATLTTNGTAPFPLLQGRCVGGSTAINSGIIWRLPEDVRHDWHTRFGLGELMAPRALARIFDQLEQELGIAPVGEDVLGGNARRMRAAAEALGLPGRRIARNAPGCQGSARCLQGCPNGARQSMDVSYVPRALEAGARLYPRLRAERVVREAGRAVAVRGDVLDLERHATGTFEMRARLGVILAAGAVFSPILLRNSGLHRNVGERFQAHPGAAVVGRFAEPVGMGFGATQAYEVPQRERGFKLEALSMPPELLAARLPGAGASWQQRLDQLDCYAQWSAMVRMRALGRVRPSRWGGASVTYRPLRSDMATLAEALALLVRMMFAAGAKEVHPGIASLPETLTHPEQAEAIASHPLSPRDVHMIASHQFGGACAGADARDSVVGPDLQCHEVPGLYVMDASALPTNLGVNPQHSIMAVVWRAAERLANTGSTRQAA